MSGLKGLKRGLSFVGVIALALALAPPAFGSSGTLFITSDTTLTEDHQGNIVIAADGVTLDCAGHLVDPSDPTMWGAVLVNGSDDVTVRNCRVTNALNGIAVESSARTLVTGNEAFGNANAGIAAANTFDTRIVGNVARDNLDNGIGLGQVTGVLVSNNLVSGNQGTAGIAMFRAQSGVFEGNTSTGNMRNGFHLIESNDNVFSGNTSSGNGASGFAVFDSLGDRFESNTSTNNAWNGFEAHRSPEMTLSSNEAVANGDSGFVFVEGSNDAPLRGTPRPETLAGASLSTT